MSPIFFYLRHFTFFLHRLVLMVRNTFSHIRICMLDEIVKKNILVLHSNKKPFLIFKNAKFKPWKKAIPSWGYFVNTMGWIILVQVIKGVLFMPKTTTQCIHVIPFLGYIKNPLGSITYLLKLRGVLHSHSKT
jgi:hypothetical protein